MSNRRRLKSGRTVRNLRILAGRGLAETGPGQDHIAHIYHDADCAGLAYKSMAVCDCKPEIVIEKAA